MAGIADVGLIVSKEQFQERIDMCQTQMDRLMDVIEKYGNAKKSLDQFIQNGDVTYELMLERIDENIKAARKSHAALQQTKLSLQETVSKMETMGAEAQQTVQDAIGAVGSTINAMLKIDDVL